MTLYDKEDRVYTVGRKSEAFVKFAFVYPKSKENIMRPEQISKIIERAIQRSGFTKAKVAKLAGIPPTELSNYLNGKKDFHVGTFIRVLSSVPPEQIIFVTSNLAIKCTEEYATKINQPIDTDVEDIDSLELDV